MDMDHVWDLFRTVSRVTQANVVSPSRASSSRDLAASSSATPSERARKINDHVYEVSNLRGRRPSLELIFFHGLQLEGSEESHLDTWLSRDGSKLWLLWILDLVPDARILTVSYDAHEKKTDEGGRNDMYVTTENLLHDLIEASPGGAQIGQVGSPLVLVGHCLGGLVMKQLCVYADSRLNLITHTQRTLTSNFLKSIKGLFFYATPHLGTRLADMDTPFIKGQLFQDATTLNTEVARRNDHFYRLCKNNGWKTFAIAESHPISTGKFKDLFVPEASARFCMDDFYTDAAANHYNVCRPESPSSSNFSKLLGFIGGIMEEAMLLVHECQGLPHYPIELESRALDVQKDLVGGAVLGICGMGGIGKTTLAKKIFNTMSKEFEYTCFVDNVKGIEIRQLKDRVLKSFHHNGKKLEKGLSLWSQLKGKKILLVMDDVSSEDQLKLLPELEEFRKGSCLIMTSRDREIFKFYENPKIYEVGLLNEKKGEELFCKHAFGLDRVPDSLREYVTAIVEKCNGLPLTLEVMGRYLKGRSTKVGVWKDIIHKLGKAIPIDTDSVGNDKVWAILKVSYVGLPTEEREMFIEAAMIFFEKPLDQALIAWRNAETTWENLVSRSMVKEITKTKYDYSHSGLIEYKEVWVHEHLRDLAESIANSNGDMVSHEHGEGLNLLVNNVNANEVPATTKSLRLKEYKGLRLHKSRRMRFAKHRPKLQLHSLLKLKQLKYLELDGVNIGGRGEALTRNPFCCHGSVGCSIGCCTFLEEFLSKLCFNPIKMDNLVLLELSYCKMPKELVEALGNLANLRILSLFGLEGFQRLPENFGNLSQLRQLVLRNFRSLVLPESFGNLSALKYLTFGRIRFLQLPTSLGDLSSLETLRIYACSNLVRLPDSFGENLASLKELYIVDCPKIECLPRDFSKLSRLELFHSEGCHRLQVLGDSFEAVSSLRKLILINVGVQRLPANFGHFSALEELTLICPGLKSLSDDFGQLTALKDLNIHSIELKTLPDTFDNLKSIQKVSFNCPKLERLPDTLGLTSSLREVKLGSCWRLKSVPDSLGKLSSTQSGLLQEHESHELRRQARECSQAKVTEGVRLLVADCRYLSDSVLGNWSWGKVPSEDYGEYKCFKRHASVVHNGVKCDGCAMFPLEGPRYKSFTRSEHNLCHSCFQRGGSAAIEYTCIACPVIPVYDPGRRCDECGMCPMEGPRYKSSTRSDRVLCQNCFQESGSNANQSTLVDRRGVYPGITRLTSSFLRDWLLNPSSEEEEYSSSEVIKQQRPDEEIIFCPETHSDASEEEEEEEEEYSNSEHEGEYSNSEEEKVQQT